MTISLYLGSILISVGGTTPGPDPDVTAPTIISATIGADGETLTIGFSEIVAIGSGGNGGFTLAASPSASLAYASGADGTALVYNIGRVIRVSESGLALVYVQPGNGVEDAVGNDLASVSGVSVTNNSTRIDLPVNTVAPSISGTPEPGETLTASPGTWTGADTITGEWYFEGIGTADTDTNFVVPAEATTGDQIYFLVTATNAEGSVTQASNTLTVASGDPIGLLVAKGDSVTYQHDAGDPSYANNGVAILDPALNFVNRGVDGSRLGPITGGTGSNWIYQVQTDVIALFDGVPDTEPKIVTLMPGNSLYDDDPTVSGKLQAYLDLIRRSPNNIRVIVVDSNPRGPGGTYSPRRDAVRTWCNANIGLYLDGFVDWLDMPDGMGLHDAALNTTWYSYPGDTIHPGPIWHTAAGLVYADGVNALTSAIMSDVSAPTIVRLSPADGAPTVQTTLDKLVARFNEPVRFRSTVTIGLYNSSGTLIQQWTEANIGGTLKVFGVDLEMEITATLADNAGYYVQIASGSIEDMAGNAFAGIANTTTWNFEVPLDVDQTANLVAFWELNESSGTRADSAGSNDLTDVNTVTSAVGKQGNAAEFVIGNDEYLSIDDNADLGYSGDFSVAGWFYRGSSGNPDYLMGKGSDVFAENEWLMRTVFESTGIQLRAVVFNTAGSSTIVKVNQDLTANTWYFFTLTFTAATNAITLSINAGTRATGSRSGVARKAHPFRIGKFGGNAQRWGGRVDEVGFWKRPLTTADEAWLYNSGTGRTYAEIVATGA